MAQQAPYTQTLSRVYSIFPPNTSGSYHLQGSINTDDKFEREENAFYLFFFIIILNAQFDCTRWILADRL